MQFFLRKAVLSIGSNAKKIAKNDVRRLVCIDPADVRILRLWSALLSLDMGGVTGELARAGTVLEPDEPAWQKRRIHRAIKTDQCRLMPLHWMREVMRHTDFIEKLLRAGDLRGALAFLDGLENMSDFRYMPRFRALAHFTRFNGSETYRDWAIHNLIRYTDLNKRLDGFSSPDGVLGALRDASQWTEMEDVVVARDWKDAPKEDGHSEDEAETKRMRVGRIPSHESPTLARFYGLVAGQAQNLWNSIDESSKAMLYGALGPGVSHLPFLSSSSINEILSGHVIGPHIHHGVSDLDQENFPFLSSVFYPETVHKDEEGCAGYLEIGRPDFPVPFEPIIFRVRPIAGKLLMFPSFVFHSVVPIKLGPRYSVAIDFYPSR